MVTKLSLALHEFFSLSFLSGGQLAEGEVRLLAPEEPRTEKLQGTRKAELSRE
jgi:hypothetical protein